ncbi:MAG: SpoIID/LytB domain-containing protein [Deltaproteobacteria bacterium]|nr:SpoIID/LytB domain-containing protein [Deltaproteobacteria bacterium]
MKEPEVKSICPPTDSIDLLVGIVLEEDQKDSITFKSERSSILLSDGLKQVQIPPGQNCTLTRSGNHLLLKDNDASFQSSLSVEVLDKSELAPKSGVMFYAMRAGRGFHWQKEIDQTYPGDFEIHIGAKGLIVVNKIDLESYLACVISSEMSSACPKEFAKSQAVAARSWALVFLTDKHPDKPFQICNDDDCQRYQGTTHLLQSSIDAVQDCDGEFLVTKSNHVCAAYYAKSCGGYIDDPKIIFGFDVPGLTATSDAENPIKVDLSKDDQFTAWLDSNESSNCYCSPIFIPEEELPKYLGSVDVASRYFRWQTSTSAEVICKNLRDKFGYKNCFAILAIKFLDRSPSGRYTKAEISVINKDSSQEVITIKTQYSLRALLHETFLYSSAFKAVINENSNSQVEAISFFGAGWGHGVGLCQIGALGMSLSGKSYRDILMHYYPRTEIRKCY